jgi:hypothetical protein
MTILTRLRDAVASPVPAATRFFSTRTPGLFFGRYARLAGKQGFKASRFILSFDCDTDLDIAVARDVHARLGEMGIVPVYAVPGKLLARGASVYRELAGQGAEFMNHGHEIHCDYDAASNSYVSSFFYDQLPRETVLNDIRSGHQAVIDVLGKRPAGFRVPHFGSFQSSGELGFLWDELRKMGYKYSSSTVPLFGFRNGPVPEVRPGFHEIPVSGCRDYPLRILDSWGFRFDPTRNVTEDDYREQFAGMRRFFNEGGLGLFNIYADPSQIHDWPLFFECLETVAPMSCRSYVTLLEELGK